MIPLQKRSRDTIPLKKHSLTGETEALEILPTVIRDYLSNFHGNIRWRIWDSHT